MLHTCNNTDGNELVTFSSIALYYDDTYIVYTFPDHVCINILSVYIEVHSNEANKISNITNNLTYPINIFDVYIS